MREDRALGEISVHLDDIIQIQFYNENIWMMCITTSCSHLNCISIHHLHFMIETTDEKKRKGGLITLMLLIPSFIFAHFQYKLDFLSFDPVYEEYEADRNRAGMDFQYLLVNDFPEGVYQDVPDKGGATYFPFLPDDPPKRGFRIKPGMGLLHIGETVSLLKNTFIFDNILSPIRFDIEFSGQIDFGFEGALADNMGYDGWYFLGPTISFGDMVELRAGLHHACSHMGDATIKLLGYDQGVRNEGLEFYKKYLRMNAVAVGLSIRPIECLRLYAEYNFLTPWMTSSFNTTFFAPSWFDRSGNTYGKDESYHGDIVNWGIEFTYPIFPKLGNTTIAYDCRAYEEGRIVYRLEDMADKPDWVPDGYSSYYDRSLPWEFEHNLMIAQEFNDCFSLEIGFHHGRFPINTYYHQRSSYVYLGARMNLHGNIPIVA